MDILTLNCGSSSLKYQLYRWEEKEVLASGIVERVTVGGSFINHYSKKSGKKIKKDRDCPHHRDAIELIIMMLPDRRATIDLSISRVSAKTAVWFV